MTYATIRNLDKQEHTLKRCKDGRIYCTCNYHRIFGTNRSESFELANAHLDEVMEDRTKEYMPKKIVGNKV